MDSFKKQQALKPYFANAYGFAVFDTIAKAGIGIGGAGGKGSVYVNNQDGTEKKIGESTLMQLSYGFQFGGTVYSEIIFFETERDLQHFTSGNFEFGANAGAVALTASASASSSTMGNQGVTAGISPDDDQIAAHECTYAKGCKVYTLAKGGLMYEASVSGQKFSYKQTEA
jgi:lipid-binding SYLF domain-containing protein